MTRMTRQHFAALAAALHAVKPRGRVTATLTHARQDTARLGQWTRDALAMADVCATFNPAFERSRFLATCAGLRLSHSPRTHNKDVSHDHT